MLQNLSLVLSILTASTTFTVYTDKLDKTLKLILIGPYLINLVNFALSIDMFVELYFEAEK